jgi:hypothetical protein
METNSKTDFCRYIRTQRKMKKGMQGRQKGTDEGPERERGRQFDVKEEMVMNSIHVKKFEGQVSTRCIRKPPTV